MDVCPHDAIELVDDRVIIDKSKCVKCGRCSRVCEAEALVVPISEEGFQKGLAESAHAVVSTFDKGRILYINFITEVQPECDCMPMADTPLIRIKEFVSSNPAALTKPSQLIL